MTTVERWATIAAYAVVLTISGFLAWHLGYAPDEGSHLRIVHHYAHSVIPPDWESWQYGASRGHAYYLFSPVAYATYIPFEWINEAVGPVGHAARGDRFITRLGGLPIAAAQLAVQAQHHVAARRQERHDADRRNIDRHHRLDGP